MMHAFYPTLNRRKGACRVSPVPETIGICPNCGRTAWLTCGADGLPRGKCLRCSMRPCTVERKAKGKVNKHEIQGH